MQRAFGAPAAAACERGATMAGAGHADATTQRVIDEMVRVHYGQFPAMAVAPFAGVLFTAWVLWGAVPNHYLAAGMVLVGLLSATRLWLYWRYRRADAAQAGSRRWRTCTVVVALLAGGVWGSAAPLLYPPLLPGYEVFVLVLLALVPIVPVAALAAYMPAFYAYYLPCAGSFVATLALHGGLPERLTAVLLVMMMGAMVAFARHHSRCLAEAVRLRFELAEKSEALEQAVWQKSQFIAAASHDLRQPVHSMGLFLESLRHQTAARGDAKWLDHIAASLASLRSMLTNMLDLSRLDAAVVRPQCVDFAAADLVGRLHDEFAALAARQGLELRCRGHDLAVRSDPALLERVLRNLLSNALQCTQRGGVLLACRPHASAVSFEVWDTGVGIADEHREAIFREFTRFDPHEGAHSSRGLGLGLAIVKRLCGLLGHEVQLRSRRARGSVFKIVVQRSHAPVNTSVAAMSAPSDVSGALVAVIDDDEGVRAGVVALLEKWGCRSVAADTLAAAAQRIEAAGELPDLLLVDHGLQPSSQAPQTIDALQRRFARPLPVILITGDTAPSITRQAYAAGQLLLHKPVDPVRLKACIAAVRTVRTNPAMSACAVAGAAGGAATGACR